LVNFLNISHLQKGGIMTKLHPERGRLSKGKRKFIRKEKARTRKEKREQKKSLLQNHSPKKETSISRYEYIHLPTSYDYFNHTCPLCRKNKNKPKRVIVTGMTQKQEVFVCRGCGEMFRLI
jgi:hypothetical protein